jgi:polyisoprenoid-binding protein YceI
VAASAAAAPTDAPAATATGGSAGSSAVEGTWTVDPSIGSFADFTNSFVGYRVEEVLAQIGSTTAVGRTPDVTGTLSIEGTTLTAVEIEADLTTLESDSDLRDGQLRRQGLETGQFPTGTFVLTEPIALEAIPADGETISATAIGDLTLHGQTVPVQIPIQAQLNSGVITVVGSLEIVFGDFGMTAPSAARVLEIDDHGVMEFQLHFTRT